MSSLKMGTGHAVKEDSDDEVEETTEQEEVEESKETEEESEGEQPAETTEEQPEEETEETKEEPTEEQIIEARRQEAEKLRSEITELRAERRKAREESIEEPIIVERKTSNDLADIAESDVEIVEKVIKAKGYMSRDEFESLTYKEKLDSYKDQWLEKHPEYLPENDEDDKNWKQLNTTVSSYFKSPKNPRDIEKVLDLAHEMVNPKTVVPKTRASVAAAKEKLQATKRGGGGSTGATKKSADPELKQYLHGFDDDELNEMFN